MVFDHVIRCESSLMTKPLTIADLKKMAQRRVPKMFFDYADSGA